GGREALVRRLRPAPQREIAGDPPDEDEDEERGDGDRDPASPVPVALGLGQLRPGPFEPVRRPVGARRRALRLAEGRHTPFDATSSVDAIGLLSLRHSAAYRSRVAERAIGIDVGGTKIAAGVIDREGSILHRVERPTPTESRDAFLEQIDEIVEELRGEGVAAIGFGLPSTIDQRTGRVVGSVHVPLEDFDFRDHAAERFSVPVALDNDGNAAAIAEWKIGAGRGSNHMVMLTLGTGVGGGLILDGKPYRG